ncbi:MAG TPA: tetratricopeptide repeat protein, partial [Woeseiaceae bacterium]|nr:tetratricopeptide repeat protein [Woeseiaceae bacterium]
ELKKSLELNPNLARAHFGLGLALHWAGQAEEALSHYHWAIRQSPRDPLRWAFENGIGSAYIVLGKHEQAMEWCRAAATHPDCSFWPHVNLAVIHDHFGQHGDAKTAIDAALSKRPNLTVKAIAGMLRGMNPRYKEAFLNKLRKAGLPE